MPRGPLFLAVAIRVLTAWILALSVPVGVSAADVQTGVVYGTGSVYLDGAQLANSMPVMVGDIVETKDISAAHIDMSGSTAMIDANAIVRFRDGGLALDRGTVFVATGKSTKVFARDFEITPTSTDWTQFQVVRSNGLIHISALKKDVEIKCGAQAPTVIREGHQLTRADAQNCGLAEEARPDGAPTAATGPLLSSPWVEWGAVAAGGGVLVWTILQHDDAMSPSDPSRQQNP